jgi:hypothetical protein
MPARDRILPLTSFLLFETFFFGCLACLACACCPPVGRTGRRRRPQSGCRRGLSEVSAAAATATGCTETRVAAAAVLAVLSYFGNKCAALVARS